jgi:hypothetical protein
MAQSTISAIELGRINLGVERTKILEKALNLHRAIFRFKCVHLKKEVFSSFLISFKKEA